MEMSQEIQDWCELQMCVEDFHVQHFIDYYFVCIYFLGAPLFQCLVFASRWAKTVMSL